MMRALGILALCAAAGCTSSVTVPRDQVVYQVPPTGVASSNGAVPLDGTSGSYGATQTTLMLNAAGTPIGADSLNLGQFSLEQQKIDAAIAEQNLASARSQLVVVPTTGLPNQVQGVNIALYAQQTTNLKGQQLYRRSGGGRLGSGCGRYSTPDDAQRAFLAAGGPQSDQYGLDPDGDGFACRWDPEPYRALSL